jgi:phage antirepressor YoqD-like protein
METKFIDGRFWVPVSEVEALLRKPAAAPTVHADYGACERNATSGYRRRNEFVVFTTPCPGTHLVTDIAKELGLSGMALNAFLCQHGYNQRGADGSLYPTPKLPANCYKRCVTAVRTYSRGIQNNDILKYTAVGRDFIIDLWRAHECLR